MIIMYKIYDQLLTRIEGGVLTQPHLPREMEYAPPLHAPQPSSKARGSS